MNKKKTNFRDFSKLKTAVETEQYLQDRITGHAEYFHYTDLGAIDAILAKSEFRISSIARMNDENEKSVFPEEQRNSIFALCFSTGKNENLSLWYMYSGIDGKGGRLRFTRNAIKDFIENCTYTLYEYDYDAAPDNSKGDSLVLVPGNMMEQTFLDVLYFKEKEAGTEKTVDLKYNTMTNYNQFPLEEFKKHRKKYPGFHKNIVWYYEKEARLLIKLKGEALKFIKPDKQYAIFVTLTDSMKKKLSVRLGPEIKETKDLLVSTETEYPNIVKFLFNSSNVEPSDSAGQIKMNLKGKMCKSCKKCDNCENNLKGKNEL